MELRFRLNRENLKSKKPEKEQKIFKNLMEGLLLKKGYWQCYGNFLK
jgi:hypothetical protein